MRTTITAAGLALLTATGMLAAGNAHASSGNCDRIQRSESFAGKPLDISVSPDQFTEVVFPDELVGILPEQPEGMRYHETPGFADRLFFSVEETDYRGIVILQAEDGTTYHLRLVATEGCADSTVSLLGGETKQPSKPPEREQQRGRKLMEYLLLGETPPGYQRERVKGSLNERLVFEQGSVRFFLEEVYKGYNYKGYVLRAVNEGRVPYRVAIEGIDFTDRGLRQQFGRVSEITMQPYDMRLDPAPEYAADVPNSQHQGLVFIVSENRRGF